MKGSWGWIHQQTGIKCPTCKEGYLRFHFRTLRSNRFQSGYYCPKCYRTFKRGERGIYYKVLREDLTSIGLRGCKPTQYKLNEWIFMNAPEKLRFANQSAGGLNVYKTKFGVKWLRKYVKERYSMETIVFECDIGKILYESRFKIETDKIKLIRDVTGEI